MKVLGISAFYHDSAACLLVDGLPVAAVQEERFSRIKNDPGFPVHSIDYCLAAGGITASELDAVVFYDKPLLKFERLLKTSLARAPFGLSMFRSSMPSWLKQKLWIPREIEKRLSGCREILFASHHLSHAAAAFAPSPWERAAVLTIDGVGEWATCSYGTGDRQGLELLKEIRFPHSVGLLYSAVTAYLGFKVNEGEYKVMGLAPYGEPRYAGIFLEKVICLHEDGSFRLDLRYFSFLDRLSMFSERISQLLGGPPRRVDDPIEQRHMDIAASIQLVTEKIVLNLAAEVHRKTGEENLCLAGGVALNCVANGRLLREGPFQNIWIQPAAGDAGGSLGAAYLGHLALGGVIPSKHNGDLMFGSCLGPEYSVAQISAVLQCSGLVFHQCEEEELLERVIQGLVAGKVGGWFQGRMEFGPRALGQRSILADPRRPEMQRTLNMKIKFREGFRPFAPSILEEYAAEYFELEKSSPYMLLVSPVARSQLLETGPEPEGLERLGVVRSCIPAVTHVNRSARVQTVSASRNPLYHRLLLKFHAKTGCPLLVNTSFNIKDEPIVCSPADALDCFEGTGMDFLAIGPFWVEKGTL